MKKAIAILFLMGLVPLAQGAQAAASSDASNCAWGTGSFEEGCDARDAAASAYIKKFPSAAGSQVGSVSTSRKNSPQSVQVDLKYPARATTKY